MIRNSSVRPDWAGEGAAPFAGTTNVGRDRAQVAAAIREILSSDAGLIALAAAGRNDAANESRRLRRGSSATAAYTATRTIRVRDLPQAGNDGPLKLQASRDVIDLP